MFYSTNILQKKGPLGTIWIAAHHDVAKKLTKLQILNTDIVESAGVQCHPLPPCSFDSQGLRFRGIKGMDRGLVWFGKHAGLCEPVMTGSVGQVKSKTQSKRWLCV